VWWVAVVQSSFHRACETGTSSFIGGPVAIRRHQVACHREWMIRAFALAIGISVVRVVGAAVDLALTPVGVRPAEIFVISIWAGWVIAFGSAYLNSFPQANREP
jgi:uncharacterized membrane protein